MRHFSRHPLLRHALWLMLIMTVSLALAVGWFLIGLTGQVMTIWSMVAAVMWVGYWHFGPPARSSRSKT